MISVNRVTPRDLIYMEIPDLLAFLGDRIFCEKLGNRSDETKCIHTLFTTASGTRTTSFFSFGVLTKIVIVLPVSSAPSDANFSASPSAILTCDVLYFRLDWSTILEKSFHVRYNHSGKHEDHTRTSYLSNIIRAVLLANELFIKRLRLGNRL